MRRLPALVLTALALAVTLGAAPEAEACGGCFHMPGESTQVASHRMVLSVSQAQSTLWDQIKYAGSPSSFAWVLPTRGPVTVGLSSDALFAQLDALTAVTVVGSPPCSCAHSVNTTTEKSATTTGVTVIAQAVVGPYATVQLSSTDPQALTNWLTSNGYAIPADVAPIVAAYVAEGFDFLALKLVPGAGVDSMKPVSVTTPGASPVLPLRMVAAGVGATVPITLFVLGEGRYQPTNFPFFTIQATELVWDVTAASSNYASLRQAGFTASGGKGWLVESANPVSASAIMGPLTQLAQSDPANSGYADAMGNGAPAAAAADLATLLAGISPTSLYVTRLLAELPRAALTSDLTLGASSTQGNLPTVLSPATDIDAPTCNCGGGGNGTGTGGNTQGGGCAVGDAEGVPAGPVGLAGLAAAALAMAIARRRGVRPPRAGR